MNAAKPEDIPTRETVAFLTSHLPVAAELLEVGCGDGEVAAELLRRGYHALGLDSDSERVARAKKRGAHAVTANWPDFAADPVDAVAFTRSLHHIHPLDRAILRARELLKPDGLLLIEDFSYDEADRPTVEWFRTVLRSKDGSALINPSQSDFVNALVSANDPIKAWREHHDQDLHSIQTITREVERQFTIQETRNAPYLYRYLAWIVDESAAATNFVERILREELELARQKKILLIGRRIVARMVSPRAGA